MDDHTVAFHFSDVYANQLFDAVQGVILPAHVWSALPFEQWRGNGPWFEEHLVTNGPFTLESWEPQQRFVLQKNPRYFEAPELPKADRIVVEIVPDQVNQLRRLRSGGAHFVELIQPSEAKTVEGDPDLYLISYLSRLFYFLGWNAERPPFDRAEVRRALTLGIDRHAIAETLYYGYAEVSHSPLPSDVWAHHDGIEPWPYDPDAARDLLSSAGFEDADGDGWLEHEGQPFRFDLATNSESALRRDVVLMVQEQLKRIGVDVQPRVVEFNSLIGALQAHDFDAFVMSLGISTDLDLSHNFSAQGIETGYNWMGWTHPEAEELFDRIAGRLDPLGARGDYLALQELLHREQPVTFLYEARRLSAVRRELRDVDPKPVSPFVNLRFWRLEADR